MSSTACKGGVRLVSTTRPRILHEGCGWEGDRIIKHVNRQKERQRDKNSEKGKLCREIKMKQDLPHG